MIDRGQLIGAFARNLSIIKAQTAGLSHPQSLLQLPFRGNCMNWVLGHLLENRHSILQTLGQPPIMSQAEAERYGYGSEPVTCDGEDVLRMEDILARLEQSQELLAAALQAVTDDALSQPVDFAGQSMTVGGKVFFLYFHDTYHTGQLEQLRQLAGTNDKVI